MARVLAGSPPQSLPLSAMKEQFSLGYVHMVASAAGFSIKSHATDYDGVYITIFSSAEYETYYCPQFELQVKCTSQRSVVRPQGIAWQIIMPLGILCNWRFHDQSFGFLGFYPLS